MDAARDGGRSASGRCLGCGYGDPVQVLGAVQGVLPGVPPERVAGFAKKLQDLERDDPNVEVQRAAFSAAATGGSYVMASGLE